MTLTNPINNEVFDTRDLIEYKNHLLEEKLLTIHNEIFGGDEELIAEPYNQIHFPALKANCSENELIIIEEFEKVLDFCEQLSELEDFEHGVTVIHEDFFEEYAKEEVQELYFNGNPIPFFIEIDWHGTAENMKQDYLDVEYEGETYYARA